MTNIFDQIKEMLGSLLGDRPTSGAIPPGVVKDLSFPAPDSRRITAVPDPVMTDQEQQISNMNAQFSVNPADMNMLESLHGQTGFRGRKPRRYDTIQDMEFAEEEATRKGLNPNLIRAIIRAESSENPKAVSKVGAQGYMQLMAPAIEDIKRYSGFEVTDPFDPIQNITGGITYFDYLKNSNIPQLFKNRDITDIPIDNDAVLAAYNWGGRKFANLVKKHGKNWRDHLPNATKKYIKDISKDISETEKGA